MVQIVNLATPDRRKRALEQGLQNIAQGLQTFGQAQARERALQREQELAALPFTQTPEGQRFQEKADITAQSQLRAEELKQQRILESESRKEQAQIRKEQRSSERKLKEDTRRISQQKKVPKTTQFQAATFAKRVEQAEADMANLAQTGFNRAEFGSAVQTFLPEALKPEELKLQDQAERNFVNAVLRRESGAAIAPSEFTSAEKQYFPRAGDTPEVLEQKAKNRSIVFAGLKSESGEAFTQVSQQLQTEQQAVAPIAPQQQVIAPVQQQVQQSGLTQQQRQQRIIDLRAKAAQGR